MLQEQADHIDALRVQRRHRSKSSDGTLTSSQQPGWMSNGLGRNDSCACGRGRKFKKCQGSFDSPDTLRKLNSLRERQELQMMVARHDAQEFQRREQQGVGKPIMSTEFQDHRVAAVGRTLRVKPPCSAAP